MLKSYQASIDLEKNVLRIQGREIPFLAEHELPAKARGLGEEEEALNASRPGPSSGTTQQFPGSGATLGGSPAPRLATAGASTPGASNIHGPNLGNVARPPATPSASRTSSNTPLRSHAAASAGTRQTHSEANIAVLMDLGATREVAISMLDAAGGNVDAAASLMF
ncbi:hypothetical protein F5880DRAFT_160384 [Lentinula raphanica]|nr:hypothetical protein F5880DRAFT_160384 [Lentinula raphanica]